RPGEGIDQLRDVYWHQVVAQCDRAGLQYTRYNTFAGIEFAAAAINCDTSGYPLVRYYVGAGLNAGVEWDFTVLTSESDFDAYAKQYFNPMLKSLNIYANP
ncbi:MAG TPA: hypothetical protein VFL91_26695, partial [Thermomicrobiales bacterium]|nr:hypothetical protein [Thermomicrobiales bacterium]